jgi:hypothetical protein
MKSTIIFSVILALSSFGSYSCSLARFLLLNETGQYLINIKSSNDLASDFGFSVEEEFSSAG